MAAPKLVSIAQGQFNLALYGLDAEGRLWFGEIKVPGLGVNPAKRGTSVVWRPMPCTFEEVK